MPRYSLFRLKSFLGHFHIIVFFLSRFIHHRRSCFQWPKHPSLLVLHKTLLQLQGIPMYTGRRPPVKEDEWCKIEKNYHLLSRACVELGSCPTLNSIWKQWVKKEKELDFGEKEYLLYKLFSPIHQSGISSGCTLSACTDHSKTICCTIVSL